MSRTELQNIQPSEAFKAFECVSCSCELYDNEKKRNMALCNNCTSKILKEHASLKKYADAGTLDFSQFSNYKNRMNLERNIRYAVYFNNL